MTETGRKRSFVVSNWVMLILAAWVFVSPWVIGPAVGAAIALLSALAILDFAMWEDQATFVLAVWLFISPWFMAAPMNRLSAMSWNSYCVGAAMAVLSIIGLLASRRVSA